MTRKKTPPKAALEITHLDPRLLKPAENNPRVMPGREMEALKEALKHWGFVDPIVVRQEDMEIIGGHQRVTAAIEMGLETVPVVLVDVSKVDAMILNEALNRIHGAWDEPQLALHQEEIRLAGGDLKLTGFTHAEINMLRSGRRLSGQVIEPPTPEPPETPVTQPGDVWQIGAHRLVCGDAADPVVVSKALADQPVGLLFTDPPYGRLESLKHAPFETYIGALLRFTRSHAMLCFAMPQTLVDEVVSFVKKDPGISIISICRIPVSIIAFIILSLSLRYAKISNRDLKNKLWLSGPSHRC